MFFAVNPWSDELVPALLHDVAEAQSAWPSCHVVVLLDLAFDETFFSEWPWRHMRRHNVYQAGPLAELSRVGLCMLELSDVASNHADALHLLKGRVNHKPMFSLLISALAPDMLAQSWPPCHTESAWPLDDMRFVQLVDACEPDDCAQSDRHAATRFAETPISIGLSRACRAMFALGGSWRVACCAGLPCDGDDWFESGRGIHDASRLLKNA